MFRIVLKVNPKLDSELFGALEGGFGGQYLERQRLTESPRLFQCTAFPSRSDDQVSHPRNA